MLCAQVIIAVVLAYLALGILFALWFVIVGVTRLDPGSRGAPFAFRMLILPGVAVLWPVMLIKSVRARAAPSPPAEPHP